MAVEKKDQFWRRRLRHGRRPIFEDPIKLWEAAVEYFVYTDKRVIKKQDYVGKDAIKVYREFSPPYTITGLCVDLGISLDTWINYKKRSDFLDIINDIEQIIYSQKFEGAAAGVYNANIIARDLGLAEKTENKHDVTPPVIENGKDLPDE